MFGEMLLHTIGGVYISMASRHLGKGNLTKSVAGTSAYWKQKRHNWSTHITAAKSMVKMYKASKNVKEDEKKMPESKDMAVFLEGAWNVSVIDVESTLRHICKKALTDTSVPKAALVRRAEAMLKVGQIFMQAESPDSLNADGAKKTLRESLEAFIGPLSGFGSGGGEEEEVTHSVSLIKGKAAKDGTSGFGFEVGADNIVSAVTAGSAAAKAGVIVGDLVVTVNGEPLGPPVADSPVGSAAAALTKLEAGSKAEVGLCSAAAREARQTAMLPPGTLVVVDGLVGAAQHNGKRGVVVEFDGENGRYVVQVEDGNVLKLQPKNVVPLDGAGQVPEGAAAASADRAFSRDELMAMSVKELKALMVARGLSAEGCIEKADYVNQVYLAQPGVE